MQVKIVAKEIWVGREILVGRDNFLARVASKPKAPIGGRVPPMKRGALMAREGAVQHHRPQFRGVRVPMEGRGL
jgi:hypothetical protein